MDNFEFDADLRSFFQTSRGAGSRITERDEASKRQLTVAMHERNLLTQFHTDIPRGSLTDAELAGKQVWFPFRLFPSGRRIQLKVNFPKPAKNELRLYFNEEAFSPQANDFWFIFERSGELWIGALDDSELQAARDHGVLDEQNGFDQATEEAYQLSANSGAPTTVTTVSTKYRRDPAVAERALNASGHVCEMIPAHPVFESNRTGKPYLEAHHFFPMMEQRHFPDQPLDVVENICILNPYAHKMVHHATYSEIEGHLKKLAEPREDFLKGIGVSVDRVLRCYGGG